MVVATSEVQPINNLEATINKYFPYLIEVRRRILFVVCVFFVSAVLGFLHYERLITFALSLFRLKGINIVFTSPFQFIDLAITSAIMVGIITTFPLAIIETLSFLKPALRRKEYRLIIFLLPLGLLLFLGGFAYGIVIMRYVMTLFYEKSLELNIGNLLDILSLLSKILVTSSLMGLAFQFPVILTILMRLKVIGYKLIVSQRIPAYMVCLIFAALLPPTDILSLVLLTMPLVFLFELTLILNRVFLKTHLL